MEKLSIQNYTIYNVHTTSRSEYFSIVSRLWNGLEELWIVRFERFTAVTMKMWRSVSQPPGLDIN
jgi:hypothetical protein